MNITRQDILNLVYGDSNLVSKLYTNYDSVLKYTKENNLLDVAVFYDKIRKSYNQKHSKVYINIMKEVEEPQKVLSTLSALLTQILLFLENSSNKQIFLKHVRYQQILDCLKKYSEDFDLVQSIDLIKELKEDIKSIEDI